MANTPTTVLEVDSNNRQVTGGHKPGTGPVNVQIGAVTTDSLNVQSGPLVVTAADATTPSQQQAVNAAGQASVTLNAGSPPSIVQKAVAKSTGSVATLAPVFANNNVAGNSIVVVLAVGNNSAVTIADTLGNTYVQAITGAQSTTFGGAIWYASGILAGANTVTITNGGSAASMAAEIYEVSGLIGQGVNVLDQASAGNNAGSGTATTSPLSPQDPNEYAFMGVVVGTAAQTITGTAGWTNDSGQQNPTTPAGFFSFASFSQLCGNMAPFTPKATFTSEPWVMVAATFRPVVFGAQVLAVDAGWNYTNITTATTTQIKTGPGVLHLISVNTLVGSATIEMDDALSHTTPKIGTITLPGTITAALPANMFYDINFATGLSITTSGATDITVAWR